MKSVTILAAAAAFSMLALCGCGALSDSASTQPDETATPQPTAAATPAAPSAAPAAPAPNIQPIPGGPNVSLTTMPKAMSIDGKPVKLTLTPTGLAYYDEKIGTGPTCKSGDTVSMQYMGMMLNGSVFDSTASRGGTPFSTKIGVGQVIPGWDQGVPGMKVGGKRLLVIPGNLAYGANPPTQAIAPNAVLVFDVELQSTTP